MSSDSPKPIDLYHHLKKRYPSHILFIKNGFFFDIFNEDAKFCSDVFGWKITKNNSHVKTGVPVNAYRFKDNLRNRNKPYLIVSRNGSRSEIVIDEAFPSNKTDDSSDEDIDYLMDRASDYESNENYTKAITFYDKILEINKDHSMAWNNKGVCYHNLNDYGKARYCYQKSLKINSKDAVTWFNLGVLFKELKKFDKAIDCFEKATQLDPDNSDFWAQKADLVRELGDEDAALDCYDHAIKIDPDNIYAIDQKEDILNDKEVNGSPLVDISRHDAEKKLKDIFGISRFYDTQWKVINNLFKGKRVLLIEKTGFGKSLCYQFPATQFSGLTVIFSPLIALMRDQVKKLNELGIPARCINSEQSIEENKKAMEDAIQGKLKIVYIAPERQENQKWIEATRKMKPSMVVVDEAHTISVWGHDFRPSFRRIINLVQLIPKDMPVLATTATATKRVQKDIATQISGDIITLRGSLIRSNLNLFVIEVSSEDEKLLWIAEHLNDIPGSGLIYTGTRVNTEFYSRWLNHVGIPSRNYNAGLDGQTRETIEEELMKNKWKCIVSTNALGMGLDKRDIRFIIHTQIPQSPIHYYQEIGRAGRDGKETIIILFYNSKKDRNDVPADYKLPKAFIDGGKPKLKKYLRVIDELKEEQLGLYQLMKRTNLKKNQVRVITADLIDQGIIKEVVYDNYKRFEYQFNAPDLKTDVFEELRRKKISELDAMIKYVYTDKPRMKFLCDFLGDDTSSNFLNCDNTRFEKIKVIPKEETKERLRLFKETYFPILDVGNHNSNLVNGIAGSYYGFSNTGEIIHRCKYENGGDFPNHLLSKVLRAFKSKFKTKDFDLILFVPPTCSGDLVKNFAIKISGILGIPISQDLTKTRITKPQKVFNNGILKRDNVSNAFTYLHPSEIKGKRILLIDDIFDSGATIKEIGKMLTDQKAKSITPIVIAKAVGGDI